VKDGRVYGHVREGDGSALVFLHYWVAPTAPGDRSSSASAPRRRTSRTTTEAGVTPPRCQAPTASSSSAMANTSWWATPWAERWLRCSPLAVPPDRRA
jgi:hypothetical protein